MDNSGHERHRRFVDSAGGWAYITYSNSPRDLTEETVRESKAALERLTGKPQAQP
jgi:hypothetical protein